MFITTCVFYVYYNLFILCLLQLGYFMFVTTCLFYIYYNLYILCLLQLVDVQ